MNKLVASLSAVCLFFCSTGCVAAGQGSSYSDTASEADDAKNGMLYGMCYIASERENVADNAALDTQLMYNLGVGCVRNWLHITDMLQTKNRTDEEKCAEMHKVLAEQKKKNMAVIGMSHTNFNTGSAVSGKPARDISDGSYYVQWLRDYYTSWKTLVSEFPEVDYWEIENEINNADFMKNINGEAVYSLEEMAAISADMLYYASRAIHTANPKAKTVLGGLTEPSGLGHGENVAFMELLYKAIGSGEYGYFYGLETKESASDDPDDYFEIACWHPYVHANGMDKEKFIGENDKIYDVVLKYEPEGKDVFFTEIGFSNAGLTEEESAEAIRIMFEAATESLSYVKTITYFKLYDVAKKTWTGNYSRYGLFYDPHDRSYTQETGEDQTTPLKNGAPKLSAYAFMDAAGGKGPLTLAERE